MLSVLFVDDDAAGGGDGLAWASAYSDLQSALEQAAVVNSDGGSENDVDQIWIAEGTYSPIAELEPGDVRSASFSLVDGVALYGGFGGTETMLGERDWTAYETILSGDIGVTDDASDNAYTVVYCSESCESLLDGLLIKGGYANRNEASERRYGAGIYSSGTLTVVDSQLSDNLALGDGGAIYNDSGVLIVTNSVLLGNSARGDGGGICNYRGDLTITNSTFAGNSADLNYGGALCNIWGDLAVMNSTLAGNSAKYAGGIYDRGSTVFHGVTLQNSIVSLNYGCDLMSALAEGSANNLIGVDPRFIRNPRTNGVDDYGDLRLTGTSPAIEAGSTTLIPTDILDVNQNGNTQEPLPIDLDGGPRVYGTLVDIGAYEYQSVPLAGREITSSVVTTTIDTFDLYDGETSLREAVYHAGTDSVEKTVTFLAALDGSTICLEGSSIFLDHGVTIDASSLPGGVTIDADGRSRAFTVIAEPDQPVTITGLTIENGYTQSGGAIYVDSATLSVIDSTVMNCLADWAGGGIEHCYGVLNLINSVFSGNSAQYGGGIRNYRGDVTVTNCTLSDNVAENDGGGIRAWGPSTTTLNNSIVARNGSPTEPDVSHYSSTFTGSHNIIGDGSGQTFFVSGENGNLVGTAETPIDPGFVRNSGTNGAEDYGDLRLQSDSPAVDAGDNSLLPADEFDMDGDGDTAEPIPFDLAGAARIRNEVVDIGAYEGSPSLTPWVLYVDAAAPSGGDGMAWESAFDDLQGALDEAAVLNGDGNGENDVEEIWIAEGTYKPSAELEPGDARSASFSFVDGVTVYGGFAGTEATLEERDVSAHITMLSGDLGVIDDASDNAYTVAYCGEDIEGSLDGLLIMGGNADGSSLSAHPERRYGGGVYNSGKLTVANSTLSANSAHRGGGGTYNDGILAVTNSALSTNSATGTGSDGGGIHNNHGTLIVTNSTLSGNNSPSRGGGISSSGTLTLVNSVLLENSVAGTYVLGGGIFNSGTLTATDSTFSANSANYLATGDDAYGGAIYNSFENTLITNCTFLRNSADLCGGGLYNSHGTMKITNSVLSGNSAWAGGGALNGDGTLTMTNCTLSANSADAGGGIYNYDGGSVTIANTTVSANSAVYGGGGIRCVDGILAVNNSIVAKNTASFSPDVYQSGGILTGFHNLIGDGAGQTAFVDGTDGNHVGTSENPIDPLFARAPSDGSDGWGDDPSTPDIDESANNDYGDLRLRSDSPAVDTGDNSLLPADTFDLDGDGDTGEPIPFDLDGHARIENGTVDMGAYERPCETPTPILYVDSDASLPANGTSWLTAFDDLQDALAEALQRNSDANTDNDVDQIWIAEGTYKPSVELEPGDVRSASFSLVDGVTLYGGFAGTETTLEERDIFMHVTMLSGDVGTVGNASDNAYTVVYCGENVASAMDGLTITGGFADGSVDAEHLERLYGGGVYNRGVLEVDNCILSGNSTNGTYSNGGGIFNHSGTLTVTNGTFSDNTASGEGSGGGGVFNYLGTVTIADSVISGNSADNDGGGISNYGELTLTNSALSGNSAHTGGGIYTESDTATLTNCTISGNSADWGGGTYNYSGTLSLTNTKLWENSANSDVGGIYNYNGATTLTNSTVWGNLANGSVGGIFTQEGTLTLNNSIVAKNAAASRPDLFQYNGTVTGSHNLIGDGTNQSALVDGSDGNLVGTSNEPIDPLLLTDGRLRSDSPALDAGDNSLLPADMFDLDGDGDTAEPLPVDLDGHARIENGTVDMGAYERPCETPILYVDSDVSHPVNGTSWLTAFADLQDALAEALQRNSDANTDNDVEQIWIAEGTYKPSAELEPGDVRSASFSLVDGVALYGGFAGTEMTLGERDWAACETILSGDIGVVDDASDNAYTVVYCGSEVESALDGVTVTGGNANGAYASGHSERRCGGGIYSSGTLTVSNSSVSGNSTYWDGGGIYNSDTLTVTNSTISGNSTGDEGGGIHSYSGTLTVTNSTLSRNSADDGGGICNDHSTLTVTNSTLSGNSAGYDGGGICNEYGTLTVTNSTLSGNSAGYDGGGICSEYVRLTVTNSTLSGNSANRGGGIDNRGGLTLNNSILWQNEGGELSGSDPVSGVPNFIGLDPKFIRDPSHGGDGWGDDPNTLEVDESSNDDYGDLRLRADSRAIDAGDNTLLPADNFDLDGDGDVVEAIPFDVAGAARIENMVVDIGAYERLFFNPILYVNGLSSGGDGFTWESAFQSLQEALDAAAFLNSDEMIENDVAKIWIAEGVYSPVAELEPGNPRSVSFSLVDGVALYGGFAGTETTLAERDWSSRETILSGDIGVTSNISDNAYTVVYCGGGVESVVDGITITGGNANGSQSPSHPERTSGGAIFNRGPLTAANTKIVGNSAYDNGGGICNLNMIAITNCAISGNSAWGGDGLGGGIANHGVGEIVNSTICGNSSGEGGGVYSLVSLTVTNTTIGGDSSGEGGGIYNLVSLTVANTTICGNFASEEGGGVFVGQSHLDNTIVAFNEAGSAGPDVFALGLILSGSHNLIGDGSGQTGLINNRGGNLVGTAADPLNPRFIRHPSDGGDGWGDDIETPDIDESANDDFGDLRLRFDSLALDAGDNSLIAPDAVDLDGDGDTTEPIPFDIVGGLRVANGVVDMGAYELSHSTILYVDIDAVPGGNGLTWDSALQNLQDALDRAALLNSDGNAENDIDQIWIAEGTYLPTHQLDAEDARSTCFYLVDGVTIYGGFAGGESMLDDRSHTSRRAILSGDVGVSGDSADNSYTVLYCDAGVEAALNGVSIIGGNASDTSHLSYQAGGGIFNRGTLTVRDAEISGNAAVFGGGVWSSEGSLTMRDVAISYNRAENGGGVYCQSGEVSVTKSTVIWNSAGDDGSGLYCYSAAYGSRIAECMRTPPPAVVVAASTVVGT